MIRSSKKYPINLFIVRDSQRPLKKGITRFDYIHSTANMISQFERSGINEASILMMMANQLKQLAKDYNIFISSATQVNMGAMSDDGEFKNETNIRSSKAVAD